jgi:hypothetical protein
MLDKEFSKKIPTPKKNYRLPFEKYKLPITHKWVDGIKIICSLYTKDNVTFICLAHYIFLVTNQIDC